MKTLKKHFANTVAFLCLFGTAVAETDIADKHSREPPTSFNLAHGAHKHAKTYVDAEAAGYDTLSDRKEIRTRHFQVLAMKQPAAPVCRMGSAKHWDAFIKEFTGIEIATGKQLRFKPDFKREQVLALFAGPEFRGDGYMGIELYDGNTTLKGFVFHGYTLEGKDPIAISNAAGQPFRGTFYLTTVPKQLAHKAIEFRMGYQSWGRVCSRFSPPIENAPRRAQAATRVADEARLSPRDRPKRDIRLPVKLSGKKNEAEYSRKPSHRTYVYAKIILPMKEPDKGKHPVVESWIAKNLRKREETELRAVTDWVRLGEGGENSASIWNATVDGKGWGCPVAGRVAERTADGKVKVELSGWSPVGAEIEGNSLTGEAGSRGIATVDTGSIGQDGRAFVALVVGPGKATHDHAKKNLASIPWRDFSPAKLNELRKSRNRSVLVFCRADWDLNGKLLDRRLFTDWRVINAVKRLEYTPLLVDCTNRPNEELKSFLKQVGWHGNATIVVYRPERKDHIVLQLDNDRREISVGELLDAMKPGGKSEK